MAETYIIDRLQAALTVGRIERVAAPSSTGAPTPRLPAADTVASGLRVAPLGMDAGRSLLSTAIGAAGEVMQALQDLQAAAATATLEGQVSYRTDLSRITLQGDAQLRLHRIDAAVARARESIAVDPRIATSAVGVEVTRALSALSTAGLDIAGISLSSRAGAQEASGRINNALTTAKAMDDRLKETLAGFRDLTTVVRGPIGYLAEMIRGALGGFAGERPQS